jgi:hypothetical protein
MHCENYDQFHCFFKTCKRDESQSVVFYYLPNYTDKVHGQYDSPIKYLWINDIQYYNWIENRKLNIMFILIMA